MSGIGHTFGKFATTWWLVVCLCAPHLAALAGQSESAHACCRKKSNCCCRNRTGKASAMIGDRKECARTCGMAAVAGNKAGFVERAPSVPSPVAEVPFDEVSRTLAGLSAVLDGALHQRPPPAI
ncbi:MAG: hypothetical protein JNK48_26900 [Bryobacterales bacterium]|nr:hypothetical protein [Bryobacterales bacterium]